jgi:hypothetical protein
MAQVAAGTKSPEVAGKLIASLAPPARPAAAPRITPVDARPYRYTVSEKGNRLLWHKNGKTGFTHSPADWADIVVLVEKGMIQAMLRDQNPPMSESYAQRLAKKQAA